ncbi:dynamin family protein [uncultured Cellulomonas sp.]|uniref:dynamin family protein n=1 Tax=uncultured Cellulomonas sp. TaxID=189682 RepID=UPI00260DCADF|nr:dynamin family protein [uncultured Cellulomonas sp.]
MTTGVGDEGTVADRSSAELLAALVGLRGAVAEVRLPLDVAGAEEQRDARTQVLDQLDDYLLPRLRAAAAPLLVVVGGSTGAGKSTLVNSLLGAPVSRSGVLRPTTRSPVLVHHPLDAQWFRGDRILPGMARLTGDAADGGSARALRLAASDALPPGLALLDAPDIDSVVAENRRIAAQLLGAADVWLFVTTAARYADAVPWDLLQDAARRHAQVALVLDRVDPGAREAVATHLASMLAEHDLGDSPVLVVPESPLEDGMLPAHTVTPVADWLTALGGDEATRQAAIARTRDGATADLVERAGALATAADEQRAADAHLRRVVTDAHEDAARTVRQATSDGTMLRGEVLARWQDVVGTGEFLRAVEQRVGRMRDKLTAVVRGRSTAEPELAQAIGHGLEAVIQDAAEGAAERSYTAWRADPAGAALLDGLELARGGSDLRARIAEQIRGWQSDVLSLVAEEGADKRSTARALSLGVNGLGAALMVAVFASTGGLTGAEVGIAGGSALLAQRLLEAVFGDDAVRQLTKVAHQRLDQRVGDVLAAQAQRFTVQLDALGAGQPGGTALRDAVTRVRTAAAAVAPSSAAGPVDAATGLRLGTPTSGVGRAGDGVGGASSGRGRLRGAGLTSPAAGRVGAAGTHAGAPAGSLGPAGAGGDETTAVDARAPRPAQPEPGGLRGWWQRFTRGPDA